MAKVSFNVKTIKDGLAIANKIYKLKEFSDTSILIETPKRAIAWVGSAEEVDKYLLKKIINTKLS